MGLTPEFVDVGNRLNRRGEFAFEFLRTMQARVAQAGPPPLGLHVLMGTDAGLKMANMINNLEGGCIAPVASPASVMERGCHQS